MLTRYVERDLTWIDLIAPTPQEVRSLMAEFDIDPVFAEELLTPSFKPKAERRGEHLYLVLHFPVLRGMHQRAEAEIDFLLGRNFLITARYGESDRLHAFSKAFEVHSVLRPSAPLGHGGHLFAAMARNLYHALRAECDAVNRRLEHIEEHIFSGDERQMVIEISQTARVIHDFRQALLPHAEMLQTLEPLSSRLFGQDFAFYLRGVMGEEARVRGAVEHLREALHELRETNNSLLNTKQNEIMKTLTMMAFVTFPLTLIATVFSMDTRSTPIVGAPGDFWIVIGIMGALALGFFIYFVRKGWL